MTVEELKAEAKKLGYKIIKVPEKIEKLGCVCGASSRCVQQWYHFGTNTLFFKCKKCGRKSKEAKTEAIKLWNEAVKNNSGEEE